MAPPHFDRDNLSPSAGVALALALLDQGELGELREVLEALRESLGVAGSTACQVEPLPPFPALAAIPDGTVAAATAATLELVGNLDDEGFERAFAGVALEQELLHRADDVAAQVLDAIPAEAADEIVPPSGSPFATRTFADLLERQGHEAEALSLRSSLARRGEDERGLRQDAAAPDAPEPHSEIVTTLERWLENLGRTSA